MDVWGRPDHFYQPAYIFVETLSYYAKAIWDAASHEIGYEGAAALAWGLWQVQHTTCKVLKLVTSCATAHLAMHLLHSLTTWRCCCAMPQAQPEPWS